MDLGQPAKNEKQAIIPIVVVLLLIIVLDYLSVFNLRPMGLRMHQGFMDNLFLFMYKWGEIIRAMYIMSFSILCYMAYTNKLVDKTSFTSSLSRSTLIIIAAISSIVFIECFRFGIVLTKFIYPIALLTSSTFIVFLMASLGDNVMKQEDGTVLGIEKDPIITDLGFVLRAEGGYINIPNIFRSALVIGGAGSGKSYSLAEPLIEQAIQKGFSGIIYDVKYSTLGDVAYSSFLYHKQKNVKFFPVSFTDVARSYRFNPLDPSLLKNAIYAEEYAYSLYSNLDKSMQKSGGGGSEFFSQSAITILKGIIWFLKKKHPQYCTLPHVIDIITRGKDNNILQMILSDNETAGFVKSVKQAFDNEATDQLSGQMGSLSNFMSKLISKEVYWVFSGNDFTLDLNNPRNPSFVVLGNALDVREAMNPIIAMIFTISLKLMNVEKRNPSLILIDEGPTVQIPKLDTIPATARANKVGIVYFAQDFSQMDSMYGKDNRKALVANLAYQFYGKVSDLDTAKYVSDLVGDEYRTITSWNKGGNSSESGDSTSRGVSYSEQKRKIVEPNQMITLEQGRFVGASVEASTDFFSAKLKGVKDYLEGFEKQVIPDFVQNFELDLKDMDIVSNKVNDFFENADFYRQNNRDLNALYNKYYHDDREKLRLEVKKVFMDQEKERKKDTILMDNFNLIQSEVDQIMMLYEDTSLIDNLISK